MNFTEVKEQIRTFIKDELISLEPWIVNSKWSEKLPKLNEFCLLYTSDAADD